MSRSDRAIARLSITSEPPMRRDLREGRGRPDARRCGLRRHLSSGARKFPALLAFGIHNKDCQGRKWPRRCRRNRPGPAMDRPTGVGRHPIFRLPRLRPCDRVAARDRQIRRRRLARVGQLRPDRMDRGQPWCDGRVGMVGIGGSAQSSSTSPSSRPRISRLYSRTIRAAPTDARRIPRRISGRRAHLFRYLVDHFAAASPTPGRSGNVCRSEGDLVAGSDGQSGLQDVSERLQLLAQRGSHPPLFQLLIDPYDKGRRSPGASSNLPRSGCRSIRVRAGTDTRTRPISTARRTTSPTGAEEAHVHRAGPSRAAVPRLPPRNAEMVRPLAQRHQHRRHARAAGEVLGHGRQAWRQPRTGLSRNPMEQALSPKLGAALLRPFTPASAISSAAGRVRPDATDPDE